MLSWYVLVVTSRLAFFYHTPMQAPRLIRWPLPSHKPYCRWCVARWSGWVWLCCWPPPCSGPVPWMVAAGSCTHVSDRGWQQRQQSWWVAHCTHAGITSATPVEHCRQSAGMTYDWRWCQVLPWTALWEWPVSQTKQIRAVATLLCTFLPFVLHVICGNKPAGEV